MGLSVIPARSTLSGALNQRDWNIYHALAMRLILRARDLYAKEPTGLELDATVFALDSTTIDLDLNLFDWAPFRSTKAAVKMHTLLDLRGAIPAFIHISDGKMGNVKVLDILPIEAGAYYVMDRGYLDFSRLFKLHQAGAFFVTRAKRGMDTQRVYSTKTDRSTGVICDQAIRLNCFYVSRDYPEHLRRIRYKDPVSGKTLVFLTNNTTLPPLTIAALYKSRWQVELFFKWIKQHLRIKHFLGTSENAVKTPI
jgi:IS4 transposase